MKQWDAEAEEQADLDYKLSQLDRLEAKWRAQREAAIEGGYYASSYSGWLSYGTSLVTNIVENVQLKISDVHIRYEDSITVPDHRFACGITIESLSAHSCDSNWIPGFTTNWNEKQASFKLVELQSLNFYWDPLNNNETFGNINSNELADALQKCKSSWIHNFIINPVSAQARLKRDRSEIPLRTRSRPRLVCDLILNEVSLCISDWQYNQLVECFKGLDDIAKYRRFRLLRPKHPVNQGVKNWWLYAVRCHSFLLSTKENSLKNFKEDRRYVELYTKIIINPNETMSSEDKLFKDFIEKIRCYEELKKLREICMENVPTPSDRNTDEQHQGRGMLLQWFPQWLGWYGASTPETPPQDDQNVTISLNKDPNQLEDEILNAIVDTVENNSLLKRDAVFGQFNFTLKKGTLDVCSGLPFGENIPMIQLQFENFVINVESRPRSGSHFVGLSLGSVLVKDRITPNTEFPDLIKPQVKDVTTPKPRAKSRFRSNTEQITTINNEPLFLLHYERKPLSYNTDYRLLIKSQSLDVVYNTGALKWFLDFISKPHQVSATRRKIEAMKNKTKMELIKNFENIIDGHLNERKTWALEMDISAPQIIFVENFSNKNGSIVVVDFGRLQVTNGSLQNHLKKTSPEEPSSASDLKSNSEDEEAFCTPCSTPPGSHASTSDSPTLLSAISELPSTEVNFTIPDNSLNEGALHEKLYDRYNIDLTDLQVLVCKGKERWGFASLKGTSNLHVLDRFCISLQIERRVVYTIDPQFPSLTLSGTLPKLVAHVNENKIAAITTMLNLISDGIMTQSPYRSPTTDNFNEFSSEEIIQPILPTEEEQHREATKLIILQFSIDQMALEVQSRGRSIAELQVTGVKAGFSKRSADTSFSLSVHGLLLVDAIQSFGPDFELLIASHRHVG